MRVRLIVVAILAGLIVNVTFAAIIIRVSHNTNGQRRLCETLAGIIQKQDATLSQFSYYQHHPAELAKAHARTRETIKTLNCGDL